jgi:large conductance mechanosensitive channel
MAGADTKKSQTETRVVETAHGDVRITSPKGPGKKPKITVLFEEPEQVFKKQTQGFIDFIRERAVVGLAIGFIIGLQAQGMMRQFLDSFITPSLDFLMGKVSQHQWTATTGSGETVTYAWGKFLYAFISFLVVIIIVYLIFKMLRLDKLDKPKEDKKKK